MAKISVKNLLGEKVKDITLNDAIWGIEPNDSCLKKSLQLQRDASRQGTRKTKTRSEVSGGGRKPWRQKGTGRARHGSIRSVQWKGGGVAFGVIPNKFSFKINKKEALLALKSALTHKNINKNLIVVENLDLKTNKTKEAIDLLNVFKLEGKTLFITKKELENLALSTNNLGYVGYILANEINCYDLVNADNVVIEEAAVKSIEEALK